MTFTGGAIEAGIESSFSLTLSSGSEEMSAQTWTVQANNEEAASGATSCNGSPSIAITGTAPATFSITDVSVSNIAATSVTISFSTGTNATSTLEYGTTDTYGVSSSITTATASHSYAITDLTANTT